MNIAHGKPRIVVGVDESPASLAALRWAAREAGLRATRLQVVQAVGQQPRQRAQPGGNDGHTRKSTRDSSHDLSAERRYAGRSPVCADHRTAT